MSELLIANNPADLAEAQRKLIADIQTKLDATIEEARAAERMKDQMIAARLSPKQARAIHRRATDRVVYLVKIKEALSAGYCMMPDMPGEVIAVRTQKTAPAPQVRHFRVGLPRHVPDHPADRALPPGEGRYVSPRHGVASETRPVKKIRHDGSTYVDDVTYSRAVTLRDPDGIDKQFVRPQVVDMLTGAMAKGIFDEIVCVRPADTRRRSKDPIVLGRVVNGRTVAAFLIAWFVDPAEL